MGNDLDISPKGYGPRFRPSLNYFEEDESAREVIARREAFARVVAMTVTAAMVAWFAVAASFAEIWTLLPVLLVPTVLVLVALHFTAWPSRRRLVLAAVAI